LGLLPFFYNIVIQQKHYDKVEKHISRFSRNYYTYYSPFLFKQSKIYYYSNKMQVVCTNVQHYTRLLQYKIELSDIKNRILIFVHCFIL